MLKPKDFDLLHQKGISPEQIDVQLHHHVKGFPFSNITKAAIINDGIIKVPEDQVNNFLNLYSETLQKGLNVSKFVPASGAATRMFKNLFEFLNASFSDKEQLLKQEPYLSFFENINEYAFSEQLSNVLAFPLFEAANDVEKANTLINALLNPVGLNYGNLPKGVLSFHQYTQEVCTPMEEHLHEGALYAQNNNKEVHIHFTVSPEHQEVFSKILERKKLKYEALYNITLHVSFSYQKPSTDTIAVTPENEPFRKEDGEILFRPGGHGALIENLNEQQDEVVFIKNIDNVVPQYRVADTVRYKKLIAGILLHYRNEVFSLLKGIDEGEKNIISKAFGFIENVLKRTVPTPILKGTLEEQTSFIQFVLNRPIRVCGMVKNEGEPGGGPFWVMNEKGEESLQIVEGSQIDLTNPDKKEIVNHSTHFNPVDLVCSIRDYKGNKFDLPDFIDQETGFISEKSQGGRTLKALELPGLWNGAMANWLTFFVEVPISTFNPVKTVMDLLRPQHQPEKQQQVQ
ncbi:DUF4301 family protein [Marinilabiliaceae bacterium JC017]|nr:DUF4301 family protein [Marinilabiliaceae bacterium JC017]